MAGMDFSQNSVRFTKRVRNKPNELSVVDFAQKYHRRDREYPFNYSALDAAVAAVAAERILNRKLTAFLEQGLWASIGADAEATMGVDKVNTAIGPCCFRLRAGDLVRFGLLVLHKGKDPVVDRLSRQHGLTSQPHRHQTVAIKS